MFRMAGSSNRTPPRPTNDTFEENRNESFTSVSSHEKTPVDDLRRMSVEGATSGKRLLDLPSASTMSPGCCSCCGGCCGAFGCKKKRPVQNTESMFLLSRSPTQSPMSSAGSFDLSPRHSYAEPMKIRVSRFHLLGSFWRRGTPDQSKSPFLRPLLSPRSKRRTKSAKIREMPSDLSNTNPFRRSATQPSRPALMPPVEESNPFRERRFVKRSKSAPAPEQPARSPASNPPLGSLSKRRLVLPSPPVNLRSSHAFVENLPKPAKPTPTAEIQERTGRLSSNLDHFQRLLGMESNSQSDEEPSTGGPLGPEAVANMPIGSHADNRSDASGPPAGSEEEDFEEKKAPVAHLTIEEDPLRELLEEALPNLAVDTTQRNLPRGAVCTQQGGAHAASVADAPVWLVKDLIEELRKMFIEHDKDRTGFVSRHDVDTSCLLYQIELFPAVKQDDGSAWPEQPYPDKFQYASFLVILSQLLRRGPLQARVVRDWRQHDVMLLGDPGAGKSSFAARMMDGPHARLPNRPTVSMEFSMVPFWKKNEGGVVRLWDPVGDPDFPALGHYFGKMKGFVLVVAWPPDESKPAKKTGSPNTSDKPRRRRSDSEVEFELIERLGAWLDKLPEFVPCALFFNKRGSRVRVGELQSCRKIAKRLELDRFFVGSLFSGEGVAECFHWVVQAALDFKRPRKMSSSSSPESRPGVLPTPSPALSFINPTPPQRQTIAPLVGGGWLSETLAAYSEVATDVVAPFVETGNLVEPALRSNEFPNAREISTRRSRSNSAGSYTQMAPAVATFKNGKKVTTAGTRKRTCRDSRAFYSKPEKAPNRKAGKPDRSDRKPEKLARSNRKTTQIRRPVPPKARPSLTPRDLLATYPKLPKKRVLRVLLHAGFNRISIRESPSLNGRFIGDLVAGERVTVLEEATGSDGKTEWIRHERGWTARKWEGRVWLI